jgi:hypothetical protein
MKGKTREYRAQIGDIIYRTTLDVLKFPDKDKFFIIRERAAKEMEF